MAVEARAQVRARECRICRGLRGKTVDVLVINRGFVWGAVFGVFLATTADLLAWIGSALLLAVVP